MLPKDLTKDISDRLKNIRGQIDGLIKLVDDGKKPDQILNLFKAVDKALQKAHFLMLDEVLRKSLAMKIVEVANACPGNCGNEDKIEFIKDQFPNLKLDDLTKTMKEINAIAERLSGYKKENKKK